MFFADILLTLTLLTLFLPDGTPWPVMDIDKSVYSVHQVKYDIKKDGASDYLSQKILYRPVADFRGQLEQLISKELKHRGEAHITVITPPEYRDVLSEFISMEEIRHLAYSYGLQESPFHIACLGRGRVVKESADEEAPEKSMKTYYLLVESERLLRFREKVQTVYEQRGGVPGAFEAYHFFPHITVGFTDRDLHESDGVIKDPNTCWARVLIKDLRKK